MNHKVKYNLTRNA